MKLAHTILKASAFGSLQSRKDLDMANIDPRTSMMGRAGADAAVVDRGLRSYMLGIYNMMALGIALSGVVAFAVASSPALLQTLFGSPLKWVVMLAPLGAVMFLSVRIHRMSATSAQLAYWAFAALMGLSLSAMVAVFTGVSIAKAFFITAASFGALSLYGYTTKKSLSGWGTFLFMGLIGIVLASIVNIFLGSSMMALIVNVLSLLIFAGLTAYDTQKLKEMYFYGDDSDTLSKKVTMGALTLYLDFINLFTSLLNLTGERE
jgi:uncharacterized protein